MLRCFFTVCVWLIAVAALAQQSEPILVKIYDVQRRPLSSASVELLKADSSLVKISFSDSAGSVHFRNTGLPTYILRATKVNYSSAIVSITNDGKLHTLILRSKEEALETVKVTGVKPVLELKPDQTVINVDASISNAGTNVMELLEKLPGVTINREGNISLKGKDKVAVQIDGRLTYLEGEDLTNLLSGMNSTEVTQIELIDNPSAKEDARGAGGIINIKTKKSLQRGFNGTANLTGLQGFYPKSSNSLLLNYRQGKANLFLNYGLNTNRNFTKVYADRNYFDNAGKLVSILEQPNYVSSDNTAHNLRTGVDYSFTNATTLGLTFSGQWGNGNSGNNSPAIWMKANRQVDSVLLTTGTGLSERHTVGSSANFKHRFSSTRELTADADWLRYRRTQNFTVQNMGAGYSQLYRAFVPTNYDIFSSRIDYTEQRNNLTLSSGWKISSTNTDNLSAYEYSNGNGVWMNDTSKTNHFLYKEKINAFYVNAVANMNHWSLQGGLRFEATNYTARQLTKGGDFSNNYGSLFPTFFVSFNKDSANSFSLSAGRRVDRPPYPNLNPFIRIINKYTYQQGNPFLQPWFTWNVQVSHAYKSRLFTSLNYSLTTDYFSQVFTTLNDGIILYTSGNFGRRQIWTASVAWQQPLRKWWSFTMQTQINRKKLQGLIENREEIANVTQLNLNWNNQLRFKKGWSAEVSGVYNTRSQEDIQEILDPSGQLTAGLSKTILQNRGTLKLSVRDIFYTNWFKGLSTFTQSNEYFKITSDSRVLVLGFTWRFGKAYKTTKRSEGATGDEIQRVGNDSQ